MKRVFAISIITLALGIFLMAGCSGSKKTVETPPISNQDQTPPAKAIVVEKEIPAVVKEKPAAQINFKDINFDFDKYDLRPEAMATLAENARILRENAQVKILIEGHCDELGTTEYNLALGERRATAVKYYLINSGISADRISTISYGKERPLDSRRTSEAWAKNRRAAFVVKETSNI